jgi:benzil reductase ((S)-benzoin forming)
MPASPDADPMRQAIVISGASRGLGAACLELAAQRGARVLGLARSFPEPVRRLARTSDGRVALRSCDLSELDGGMPTAPELAEFLFGADDVLLLNNVATVEPVGAVGRLGAATIAAVATNLTATMLLTDAFLAALDVGEGPALTLAPGLFRVQVVFVSSSSARRPKAGTATYCATKAGGEMFIESLRAELAEEPRCRVGAFDPGGMDTDMHATLRERTSGYLPDRDRLRDLAASGRLSSPRSAARRLMDEYLPVIVEPAP